MTINIPVVNAGTLYVDNLDLNWLTSTTISMASGAARDSTNVNDIILSSTVTLNTAVVGANGLDTGTIANNSFYNVFVVGDSSQNLGTCALISLSATAPTLPFGYDMFRRIGSFRTNNTGAILAFTASGNGKDRYYYYVVPVGVLTSGNATSYTEVALGPYIPSEASIVKLVAAYRPTAATGVASMQAYGVTGASGTAEVGCGVAALQTVTMDVPVGLNAGSPSIQYKVTNSADVLSLQVIGYIDCL